MTPTSGKGKKMGAKKVDAKRKQAKSAMKKLREAIRNDPVRYEEAKRKERERYYARKAVGKIKSIKDVNEREKRAIRKKWKESSKRYYKAKKCQQKLAQFLDEQTPPASPRQSPLPQAEIHVNAVLPQMETPHSSRSSTVFLDSSTVGRSRVSSGEKTRRRNRKELNLKVKMLEEKLKKAEKRARKYKKRAYRLQKTAEKQESPTEKVKKVVESLDIGPEIKKRLLFGEVISSQLKDNFKKQDTASKKRNFIKNISGTKIKKYGFIHKIHWISVFLQCTVQ